MSVKLVVSFCRIVHWLREHTSIPTGLKAAGSPPFIPLTTVDVTSMYIKYTNGITQCVSGSHCNIEWDLRLGGEVAKCVIARLDLRPGTFMSGPVNWEVCQLVTMLIYEWETKASNPRLCPQGGRRWILYVTTKTLTLCYITGLLVMLAYYRVPSIG
jgi:hypothetical protein